MSIETKKPFQPLYTRIVGVTMGPEGSTRQLALAKIREHFKERERWFVHLIPEPDNPYDRYAIRCMVDVPELGRTHIGYIRNSGMCDFCKYEPERFPSGNTEPKCPQCGHRGTLKRNGLATYLCRLMEEDPHLNLYAEILEITGGSDPDDPTVKPKNYGCNIVVRRYVKRDAR